MTAVGAGDSATGKVRETPSPRASRAIYTDEQRIRRDETVWTTVQAILAPVQFLVFVVSLALVVIALATDTLHTAAAISVVVKTAILYTIMVTGAIWERVVFGQYLFAPAFFWEDVVSFAVIALHTAYLVVLFAGIGSPSAQLLVALAAYAAYVVNAAQFLVKMVLAKRDERALAAAGAAA
ncbi:MAG: 2-vinyl bacteriochlorophyllide hydratase [Pseudomonadota bacterium]